MVSGLIVASLAFLALYEMFLNENRFLHDNIDVYLALLFATKFIKLAFDVFVFVMFWISFKYFVSRKRESLEEHEQEWTRQHKWTLAFIVALFVMNVYHSVVSVVFNIAAIKWQ